MPATAEAAQVTNAYRTQLGRLRELTANEVVALISALDLAVSPTALDRQLLAFLTNALAVVQAASMRSASLTGAYVSAYLLAGNAAPLSVPVRPVLAPLDGLTRVRGALLVNLVRSAGRGQAITSAEAAARRHARNIVTLSAVETTADLIVREPRIAGWQRVTAAGCCKRCAVQAGKRFRDNQGFKRHPACRCSHEPILRGIPEQVQRQPPTVLQP